VSTPEPAEQPRSAAIVVACAVGLLEAVLLAGYGVALEVFDLVGQTTGVAGSTEVAPVALLAVFVAFGLLALLVTAGVWQRRAVARTPFFLMQAFAVVAAWPLASEAEGAARALGVVVIVLAVVAALMMLSPRGAGQLTR